jgi:hypothetical protein
MKGLLALMLIILTGGCATIDAAECPPLVKYTDEENEQLATEIDPLPADSMTVRVVGDYMTLRDAVEACQ